MGLDMYAFTVPADAAGDAQVDFKPADGTAQTLAYWRKFNHLHGWMERLYREKGGQGEDFNCDTVRLTAADLDRLYADASAGRLTHTDGFFFGGRELYPEDMESLTEFIRNAKREISDGKAVFYDSWW